MADRGTAPAIWHPSSWPPWAQGTAAACLTHIILATLAAVAALCIQSWSEACFDRYYHECYFPFMDCPDDRYEECVPPVSASSVVAALQSGPGPVILILPFMFLPSFDLDLSWVDPVLLMFWIPELVSLITYGCAGALVFTYLRPGLRFPSLLLGFVAATGAATFYWGLWFETI